METPRTKGHRRKAGPTTASDPLIQDLDEMIATIAGRCSQMALDTINEAIERFDESIGPKYARMTLANFRRDLGDGFDDKRQKGWAAVAGWVRRMVTERRLLPMVLAGNPGVGKDHLAVGSIKYLIRCGATVRWYTGKRIIDDWHEATNYDKSALTVLNRLAYPKLLYISDPVHQDRELTPPQREFLLEVADRRTRDCLPIWMTINALDSKRAAQMLGQPAWERIVDGGLVVKCEWPTYRGPAEVVA